MTTIRRRGLALALAAGVLLGGAAEAATGEEEQQLDVLSAPKQIWEREMRVDGAGVPDGKFAVTDLDRNGRLELLFTTTAGAEEGIENRGYEVNEQGDGVVRLLFPEAAGAMEIGQPRVTMYFACQIGTRHYVFSSARWRPMAEGGWTRRGGLFGLCLWQGTFRAELLGRFHELHEARDLPPTAAVYRDRDAKVIDEAAYGQLPRETYSGCHLFEVKLGWTPLAELAAARGDREKVRALFARSWASFREKELDIGPVH